MVFRKYSCIRQLDEKDCGAACLATILKHYGSNISLSKIRDIAGTDKHGTNALGLVKAAEQLGFSAKGVRADHTIFEQSFSLPAIAHIILDGQLLHYVVIHKVTKDKVVIADPGHGITKYSREDFLKIWTGILILMVPSETYKKQTEQRNVHNEIFSQIFQQKSLIIHTILASFIITIFGIIGTFYFQSIIDHILPNGLENTLHIISIGLLIMYLFKVLLSAFRQYLMIILGQKLSVTIMFGYFKHVLKLPMKFFNTRKVGEIISRFSDANKVIDAIVSASLSVVLDTSMLIMVGIFLYVQNSTLFFITLMFIPMYILVVWLFMKPYKNVNNNEMENNAQLTAKIVESLNGIETIKANNAEYIMMLQTEKKFVKYLHSVFKHGLIDNLQSSFKMFLDLSSGALILWIGSVQVLKGNLTIGQLITYNALLAYFFDPLQNLIGLQSKLQSAAVASKRLGEILEVDPEVKEEKETKIMNPEYIRGPIQLSNVSFRYGMRRPILKNISLNIEKGEKVAFVGESGSGKSTLAKILMNFYTPETGNILINDFNIKDINTYTLREKISYIPQESHFIQGTVLENLLLGAPENCNFEDVIKLCKLANIHQFISELPMRYDTILEESGSNLSGGQKQRLAIVRALLRKPNILIMDESTSNLDSTTEQGITNMIYNLTENITTILIAHRLSTIIKCDKIFVFENGEILEQGKHTDLIKNKGRYYEFWYNQMPSETMVNV
ncbi:peptidase domain-containing ABC transporter [Bacillus vallismortis]|uniref:peptidase domain-containing ABC transporter n=1 Tax=Bacillus vallismortis TaxID=72361 RepID=UPI000C2B51BF|nr:peptide cleavage/export ABC transporter [Bacillus vallismortis]MCY7916788.1 peptide cleavage/export ABC transporter [Bacillus vallismortis]MCY8534238.1 peptide cleavage/export ABC transporter [Bacillus vallismortis]PJZ01770.1 bacteriocin ABC transporter ATP-binding protein [Bacillus vallismortis]